MFVELLLGGVVRSYRADKTQCVYTDVVKIPEDEGVPQGSTLDPVLFPIFMNNIRKNMPIARKLLYADSILYPAGSPLNQVVEGLPFSSCRHYCAV